MALAVALSVTLYLSLSILKSLENPRRLEYWKKSEHEEGVFDREIFIRAVSQ